MNNRATVVKQGWLEKRGEHFKLWNKRYFVLYDDGMFNGYKAKPAEQEIVELSGKLENQFTVEDVGIIRLDSFQFKIRCRQQNRTNPQEPHKSSSVERNFRSITSRADRDSWCDDIERICINNCPAMQLYKTQIETTPIDLPMEYKLEYASKRLTMDSFERIKVLGRGAFGQVFLVFRKSDPTQKRMAMKVVKKQVLDMRDLEHMRTERQVLSTTDNRFLIKLYYAFQTTKRLCFVMEFAQGGELATMLGETPRLPLDRCRFYGAEITCALEFLHQRRIIYRDLKPENILFAEDGHVKIADFGLCKYLSTPELKTTTKCGTPEYQAPEVIRGHRSYDDAVDWWSLGVVLYEMIVGKQPFQTYQSQKDLYDKICGEYVPEIPTFVPVAARSLLEALLIKDPEQRLGGGERDAEEVMEHWFFHSIDFERLKRCEIQPPYVPLIGHRDDTNGFDSVFTNEPINKPSAESTPHSGDFNFPNFSYHKSVSASS